MLLVFLNIKTVCLTEVYAHTDGSIWSSENAANVVFWKPDCTHVPSKLLTCTYSICSEAELHGLNIS